MFKTRLGLKSCSAFLVVAYLLCFAPFSPAMAAWVGTSETLTGSKARLVTLMEREDVKSTIASLGVDPAEAARRVNAMTETEAANALSKIDSMPAGGDGVGTIVGAALIVFIVLLITDVLGYTNVFSFVKK